MRDPRKDPQPGDVLEKKYQGRFFESRGYIEREVNHVFRNPVEGTFVTYIDTNICAPAVLLSTWRRWAKNAKVVKLAGVEVTK